MRNDDRYDGYWRPYVSQAERRRQAQRTARKLRKDGRALAPIAIAGRKIATTFWGTAWCENLERYSDFENRLPRGRTYVRNGSVIDLQVAPGKVTALVSGADIYEVAVSVTPVAASRWRTVCARCAGAIDSIVELLQGRFSKGVMEHLCRQETGLFPTPKEIAFTCSCPDWASMCKHVAAVLYGIGARLDEHPELLFRLRQVDENELLARAEKGLPVSPRKPASGRVLEDAALRDVFGVDLVVPELPEAPSSRPRKKQRTKSVPGSRTVNGRRGQQRTRPKKG